MTHQLRHTTRRFVARSLRVLALITLTALTTACGTIDEDLSDCGQDYQLQYQLRLVTNMTTELETVLGEATDQPAADALRSYLRPIFTDYAHDVDLSFYNIDDGGTLSHHEEHVMDANQTSYTIYLPVKEYQHLALANVAGQEQVTYENTGTSGDALLRQKSGNTLRSHATGLFTARQVLDVKDGVDQTFHVRLFMANCAAALVIDTTGYDVRGLRAYAEGLADGFYVRDSVYTYTQTERIAADSLAVSTGREVCLATVGFPSRDAHVEAPSAPFHPSPFTRAASTDTEVWRMTLYVQLPDGSVTENVLHMTEPLRAGHLKVVKLRLKDQGIVQSAITDVGVSVTLHWEPGTQFDPVF